MLSLEGDTLPDGSSRMSSLEGDTAVDDELRSVVKLRNVGAPSGFDYYFLAKCFINLPPIQVRLLAGFYCCQIGGKLESWV